MITGTRGKKEREVIERAREREKERERKREEGLLAVCHALIFITVKTYTAPHTYTHTHLE